MNSGRVAAGGARARVLAEEDDEEGARGERRCGRAARNPMLSAHLRIADDVYYKDHSSLSTSDLSGFCARALAKFPELGQSSCAKTREIRGRKR